MQCIQIVERSLLWNPEQYFAMVLTKLSCVCFSPIFRHTVTWTLTWHFWPASKLLYAWRMSRLDRNIHMKGQYNSEVLFRNPWKRSFHNLYMQSTPRLATCHFIYILTRFHWVNSEEDSEVLIPIRITIIYSFRVITLRQVTVVWLQPYNHINILVCIFLPVSTERTVKREVKGPRAMVNAATLQL